MIAQDLHDHMRQLGTWVAWEHSCDGFKAGSPAADIERIAVCWQSTFPMLRKAHEYGCNLFVTHEPTYYAHMDDNPDVFRHEHARQKREFLEQTGMVVYRCHDVWDRMPKVGILDSWAKGLGFDGDAIAVSPYYACYSYAGTVQDLAHRISSRTKELGQPGVQVTGDLSLPVSAVAIGTGAITNIIDMAAMGADAVIVTDDGFLHWQGGAWAADRDLPLIVVNHAVAEEWGMQNLARYIGQTFADTPVRYIPFGCPFTVIA